MNREQLITTIFDNMHIVKRCIQARMQIDSTWGISPSQTELLFNLKHLQPVNAKKLAGQLYLTPGAISQLVDSLADLQFIEREVDPHDRRTQTLRLSKKGSQLLKDMESRRREFMASVMQDLTTNELQGWVRIQQKIMQKLPINS